MATTDPTRATSSADIFSGAHTLAQLRGIHRTLHTQIEEKATRLRAQVGGSYRELLGTADTIVQMQGENGEVQELLRRMGGHCGRDVVSSKASRFVKFQSRDTDKEAKLRQSARLKLLDNCGLVAGRILRGSGELGQDVSYGDRLLVASKMLVLSRLLAKTLEEHGISGKARLALDSSKKVLLGLRRRLANAVEKALKSTDEDARGESLSKFLCAYSLANSSGARDVLQYFLRTRGQAIAEIFGGDEEDSRQIKTEDVVHALKLYTNTLIDVQSLVPVKLSQAFIALKRQPLLADAMLMKTEGLRLDMYERWCGEDVQHFTPFIRHDDLDGKYARDSLLRWAEAGSGVLVTGLKDTLAQMTDLNAVIVLRTSVLQHWIREGGRAKGLDPSEMRDELREAINDHMLSMLEAKVTKLRLVGSEVRATLDSWQSGVTDKHKGLWEDDGYDAALQTGAPSLIQEVMSRLYGRNDAVSRAVTGYTSWFQVVGDVKETVDQLRKQRWDNDYDEIEDEETIDARQQLLSQEDPDTLQTRLDLSLDRCFADLEKEIKEAREATTERLNSGPVAMYLLRVLRDIRRQLPDRPAIRSFGLVMVQSLQETAVSHVLAPVLDAFFEDGLAERTMAGRPLWEGEPALPGQPSPALFQLLRGLSMAMADAGVDLWTPAATNILRKQLGQQLAKRLHTVFEEESKKPAANETEGDKKDEETEDDEEEKETEAPASNETKQLEDDNEEAEGQDQTVTSSNVHVQDLFIQWVYDLSLVEICMQSSKTKADEDDEVGKLKEEMRKKAGLETEDQKRMTESVKEFWQRTNLLFGLLA